MKFAVAQYNFLVGDIEGNCKKILQGIRIAKEQFKADCIVFSELAILGYPPEDLVFRANITRRIKKAISEIESQANGITVIVGAPLVEEDKHFNAALVIQDNCVINKYFKMSLPNYNVFDEKRYFDQGDQPCVVNINDVSVGITICEDIWNTHPVALSKSAGAQLLVNINASPFHIGKQKEREDEVAQRVKENDVAVLYVNQVGGQDELVFDGGSFAMSRHQKLIGRASDCEEALFIVEYDKTSNDIVRASANAPIKESMESIYNVLSFGLRDYVIKNGFNGSLIGLSGGIDSALTLTLAVDALGPSKVHAVMMPSQYTSNMSLEDAEKLASNLGVKYTVLEIDSIVNSFSESLAGIFADAQTDTTEENIQARIRGVLLMAISNKYGHMVVSTGNKSEMAVGYATLYGDMAGGFALLKDVPKTLVYDLSRYRNTLSEVIPSRIIERPPTAELAPNQLDEDSLPPYEQLDEILRLFIEEDISRQDIVTRGFDRETVSRVIKMVFQNEYKRRQAPPGIKITQRAFGKDRRYPITSGVINYLKE